MAHGGARWKVSHRRFAVDVRKFSHSSPCSLVGPKRTEPSCPRCRRWCAGSRRSAVPRFRGGIVSPHARRSTLPLAFTGARHQLRIEHRVEAAIREMGPQAQMGWDSPGGVAGRQMGPRRRESEGLGMGLARRERTASRACGFENGIPRGAQPCPATVAIVSPFLPQAVLS